MKQWEFDKVKCILEYVTLQSKRNFTQRFAILKIARFNHFKIGITFSERKRWPQQKIDPSYHSIYHSIREADETYPHCCPAVPVRNSHEQLGRPWISDIALIHSLHPTFNILARNRFKHPSKSYKPDLPSM
jgi:hypothetical protein